MPAGSLSLHQKTVVTDLGLIRMGRIETLRRCLFTERALVQQLPPVLDFLDHCFTFGYSRAPPAPCR